ncbi:MAG TPA: hypothetical protein VHB78_17435 [Vicinamibacterales bacterium]|jgi:hypothetical protein|nr:hypothetical protein [Vicinamibacterales bacterium]
MTRHFRLGGIVAMLAGVLCMAAAQPWARAQNEAGAVQASADALPAARDVIARHVAAIGGTAAFKAVRSIHAKGRLEIPAQGIGGDFELFAARPAQLLYRAIVPGIGTIESGYNGTIGWALSPISGPELLTGRQLSETAEDAWFDGPLHEADHVRAAETIGKVEFDGHQAYKLRVTLASGQDEIEYFDVESGFQLGSDASRATPQGIVPTTNITRNYRKFGPLMQATTFIQRALGLEQVVTIASCEYDTVTSATFDPPADVRALVAR